MPIAQDIAIKLRKTLGRAIVKDLRTVEIPTDALYALLSDVSVEGNGVAVNTTETPPKKRGRPAKEEGETKAETKEEAKEEPPSTTASKKKTGKKKKKPSKEKLPPPDDDDDDLMPDDDE